MHVFLVFEQFLLSNIDADWRVEVPTPQVWVQVAGKFDMADRIWVNWALAEKMSGKLIKMQVSLGFEPFLLSKNEAERRVVVPTPRV